MITAVIISAYNSSKTLSRVLDGYMHQSVFPDEVIIADDGSSDNTADVVREKSEKSPFPIKHVWQEDLGFRKSRILNKSIQLCESEYIIFTDGDCIPHRRFIEDHTKHAESGFFVQGKRILVSERLSFVFKPENRLKLFIQAITGDLKGAHKLIHISLLVKKTKKLHGVKGCNIGIFKSDCVAVNGFNEDFVGWGREDSEFVLRLYKYGLSRKDPLFSAIVFHLWHPIVSRDNLQKNDEILKCVEKADGYYCENGISKSI